MPVPEALASAARRIPNSLAGVLKGRTTLREGDHGADVRALQKLLNAKGAHLHLDGDFGKGTAAAVRGFQRSHGLEPDGVVGEATMKKLLAKPGAKNDDRLVKVGDKGKDILAAESRLNKLGYDTGKIDGRYDQNTVKAVRAFKQDQGFNHTDGAHLAKNTKDALQTEANRLDHAPRTARVKKSGERRRLDALTASRARTTGIGVGDDGRATKNVQAHLKGAGFSPGVVDGRFDARTENALKAFQRKSQLPQTGRVDAATWRALSDARVYSSSGTTPPQRLGEKSAAVLHTEKQLKKAGYNPGKVDGLFDRNTLNALHKLEHDKHMRRTDKVGAGELRAIEKAAKQHGIVRPIAARLTSISEFSLVDAEGAPGNNGVRHHAGKDWFAPGGSTVRSPVAGKVVEVRPSSGNTGQVFGGTVKVQGNDGKVWVFRHVDPKNVRVGQHVDAGQHIARVTSWRDGPSHAHIEVWKSFARGYDFENMIDPMKFLKRFL